MADQFARTRAMFGTQGMERLFHARVAVFGVGGVGGYAVEALARSGIGALDLIDDDKVCLTNLNRQIIATHETMGQYKVEAFAARIAAINPAAVVYPHKVFFSADTAELFDFAQYDYVIDAIDTVSAKVELAVRAQAAGVRVYGISESFIHPEHNVYPSTVMLGYANLREEEIEKGCRLLEKAWA